MSETNVTIVGNITKKPEIKTTGKGKLVTRVRVASTRKRFIDGRWIDGDTAYIDVDCWDRMARNVVNTFGKGDRIIAQGRLRTDEWEDEHGTKRTFTKVVADAVGVDLRFATAAIDRNRTGGRGSEEQRRSGESEQTDEGAVGVATGFFPEGGGNRPDLSAAEEVPDATNRFAEAARLDGHGDAVDSTPEREVTTMAS